MTQLDTLGAVESVKAASDIYAPISGEILETNDDLESKPSLINTDPEKSGKYFIISLPDINFFIKFSYRLACKD